MQTQKMSLANIKGKLSRHEMRNIMAGSGDDVVVICKACTEDADCFGGRICRSSPSCSDPKVCARPIYV